MPGCTDFIYNAFMYPMEISHLFRRRKHLLSEAYGDVLEIGAGTGTNLRFYDTHRVRSLTITDLDVGSPALRRSAGRWGNGVLRLEAADVEALPFPDDRFDTLVATLVFCSVENPVLGLREIGRVLKPGGSYLFIEHVLPDRRVPAAMMTAATPLWRRIAGGCRLDRRTGELIGESGFRIERMTRDGTGVFIVGKAVKEGAPGYPAEESPEPGTTPR